MSAHPFLIAQTPRAGRWNHVTLLPTAALPDGVRAADILGAAAFSPVGGNYLAAVRRVAQAGGTKEGREVLVLVGIEPAEPQRELLLHWLDKRLTELGECVTAVDWATHDGSDYRLAILDQWAEEARIDFGLTSASEAKQNAVQNVIGGTNTGWKRSLIVDVLLVIPGVVAGWLAWTLIISPS